MKKTKDLLLSYLTLLGSDEPDEEVLEKLGPELESLIEAVEENEKEAKLWCSLLANLMMDRLWGENGGVT